MKETSQWLPIAERKAQIELTFARQQVARIDRVRSFRKLPSLPLYPEANHKIIDIFLDQRRSLSTDIKQTRYALREERFKAVLRGDLAKEKYHRKPAQQIRSELMNFPENPIKQSSEKDVIIELAKPAELLLVS